MKILYQDTNKRKKDCRYCKNSIRCLADIDYFDVIYCKKFEYEPETFIYESNRQWFIKEVKKLIKKDKLRKH